MSLSSFCSKAAIILIDVLFWVSKTLEDIPGIGIRSYVNNVCSYDSGVMFHRGAGRPGESQARLNGSSSHVLLF